MTPASSSRARSLELRARIGSRISPELRTAWRWHLEHSGGAAPLAGSALSLARAELEANARGWTIREEDDHESTLEAGAPMYSALLEDAGGEVLGSLHAIDVPGSAPYWRSVRAELALEHLHELELEAHAGEDCRLRLSRARMERLAAVLESSAHLARAAGVKPDAGRRELELEELARLARHAAARGARS